MTIKASGSLNTTEIVAEWGGSQPNSLSEYYAGGSLVYSGAADGDGTAIPSSGNPIKFSDFYDVAVLAPHPHHQQQALFLFLLMQTQFI